MLLLFCSSLCVFFKALTPGAQSYHKAPSRRAKFDKQETKHILNYRETKDNAKYTSEFTNMSGVCGPNAKFSIDENGQVVIYGRGEMFNYSISNSPFSRYAEQIKSILIGNEITTIGTYSFSNCRYLENVEIGRNIEKIFDFPFYNCSRLQNIKFTGSYSPVCSNRAFSNIDKSNSLEINIQIEDSNYQSQTFCGKPINRKKSITNLSFAKKSSPFLKQKHIDEIERGSCGTDCSYNLNSETGELIISGSGEMEKYDPIIASYLMATIKKIKINHGITSIGDDAFEYCSNLVSIEIPDSVTTIGAGAFYDCSKLASIEIPDGITTIGALAFRGCSSLESIEIPNGVTVIDESTFSGCSNLASIKIPNRVTSIGYEAFFQCSNLASIEIPDSVTSIDAYAFSGCSKLVSIEIPDSVTEIGRNVFYGCSSLESIIVNDENPNYKTQNGVLFSKDMTTLIQYPPKLSETSYAIPYGVTHILSDAFYQCSNLARITIPDTVRVIYESRYYGYFRECSSLESIIIFIQEGNPNYITENGILFSNDRTTLMKYPPKLSQTSYEIPDSVTSIERFAFQNCSNLESIEIPDSVTSIDYAFSGCSSLKSIEIPNSVTSIDDYAFEYCSSLESINISNSVTTIGDYAFQYCSNLESIEIPDSVTEIGDHAFQCCSSLESITIQDGNRNYKTENGILFSIDMKTLITYPPNKNLTSYVIPNNVISIGNYAFEYCTILESIVISNSVTSIGDYAFQYCTILGSIEIPNSVTSISNYAFQYCSNLGSIVIPNSVTSIGDYTFQYCSSLESIEIPGSVNYIGGGAFIFCTNLRTVYFHGMHPPGYVNFPAMPFENCPNLQPIIITNSEYYDTSFCGFAIVPPPKEPVPVGAIAGIVIACVVVVGAIIAVVVYCCVFKKKKNDESIDENNHEEP